MVHVVELVTCNAWLRLDSRMNQVKASRTDSGGDAVMIEFKAPCGHTVRAKDEDAGRRVRCSYCGRVATVPNEQEGALGFLLEDEDAQRETDSKGESRSSRGGLFGRRSRHTKPADPVATIFRMCYAAALLIIVIVVVRKFVIPLFQDEGLAKRAATIARVAGEPDTANDTNPTPTYTPSYESLGLICGCDRRGLYLASTPSGATAYVLESSKVPDDGRINLVPGCTQTVADGRFVAVEDGTYTVEMVLPWNYPALVDRSLPNYERYRTFRHSIEHGSPEERARLLKEYFVPDGASAVFVEETDYQILLVRQYRDVTVRKRRSLGVRALFLPMIMPGGRDVFSITPLVTEYIPKTDSYIFNEEHVRAELDYYEVPEADHGFIIDALARIGVIPYVTPDGNTRLFRIGIDDGMFVGKIIREAPE